MPYKYLIKKDEKSCFFGLYPGNSNNQPMGCSIAYESIEIAENAILEFKKNIS